MTTKLWQAHAFGAVPCSLSAPLCARLAQINGTAHMLKVRAGTEALC